MITLSDNEMRELRISLLKLGVNIIGKTDEECIAISQRIAAVTMSALDEFAAAHLPLLVHLGEVFANIGNELAKLNFSVIDRE